MNDTSNTDIKNFLKVRRAIISVYDKRNIISFSKNLSKRNITLIATSGTLSFLSKEGLKVKNISEITNFPEIMDGRVKTLHPSIHGALLGKRNNLKHISEMNENNIEEIDLAVVNLYPFDKVSKSSKDVDYIIENIDIGGPAIIRSAAKNYYYTAVITDPDDYDEAIEELNKYDGYLSFSFRQKLAMRAYSLTASYDSEIAKWFSKKFDNNCISSSKTFIGKRKLIIRYGENSHQKAGLYTIGEHRFGVLSSKMFQGKELSYNNICDTNAAFELISEFDYKEKPVVAIIKHSNPCGIAKGNNLKEAYLKALSCDKRSAFGGIVAINQVLDEELAKEIIKTFTEVIIAPGITKSAEEIIKKRKNLRMLITGGIPDPKEKRCSIRSVSGGMLVQTYDDKVISEKDLKIVTVRKPSKEEIEDMKFSFCVAKYVKSNAVVLVKNQETIGIGAGQMSRFDSARIAILKAKDNRSSSKVEKFLPNGCVAASDGFFPFPDSVLLLVKAGVTAVIQPGGSIRDEEIIKISNEQNISMVMTSIRHFLH